MLQLLHPIPKEGYKLVNITIVTPCPMKVKGKCYKCYNILKDGYKLMLQLLHPAQGRLWVNVTIVTPYTQERLRVS